MKKIILKNKLTNELLELEGTISVIPDGWELIEEKKVKNGSSKKNANGDGSFYFSETLQKWIGQIQPLDGGKRITITQRKNETKTECKRRYEEAKAKVFNGTYIKKSTDTLYKILERHIEQKYKDGITSPRSYKRNTETLKQVEKTCKNFVYKPIQKVVIENIEDAKPLIREYAPNTIDKIWGMINCGFRIAHSRKKITFNIMEDDTLAKPISLKKTKQVPALTIDEENRLRSIFNNEEKDHKYRDIILLQLNTGMRIGEVLARTLDDFNEKQLSLHIWNTITRDDNDKIIIGEHTKVYDKKNQIDKGERTIPLDNESKKIILNIKNSSLKNIYNLLFWDYKDNCLISDGEVNSYLDRLNAKYHIIKDDLSTHVLRHTRITRMQEAEIPLVVIQYIVGHVEGSKITNNVYTSVSYDFAVNALTKAKAI